MHNINSNSNSNNNNNNNHSINETSFYIKTNCPKCNAEIIQLIYITKEDKRVVCGNCGTEFRLPITKNNIDGSYIAEKPYLPVKAVRDSIG